jgi:hypothetical protein
VGTGGSSTRPSPSRVLDVRRDLPESVRPDPRPNGTVRSDAGRNVGIRVVCGPGPAAAPDVLGVPPRTACGPPALGARPQVSQ